ncbi:MetI-like domain [Syntrophomonas zehnderi OL-4]|uniref:MetI-like domain n=1 Tax=Syntrophomonas zehnderi OL-4 TaxID=690567 RepID=A0A0E4GAK7_9FIRM|nr:ABC transporter permease [Syntrophomonas zehnderi]CFX51980.1 MetI-like domain [Syntrophomonas zehnderi OL-4]
MKKSAQTTAKLLPLLAVLFFILLWDAGVRYYNTPAWILPSPGQVIKSVFTIHELLLMHTATTLLEAGLGLLLAMLLAVLIAVLMDSIYWLKQALYPLVIISQTIPLIVLTVLFVIWFGFGMLPKILVVILVCFFPILISLINGLESVDDDQIQLFRSMGAGRLAITKMVKIPAALPSFFSGLRISATYSIMGAIIGEWMGAEKGLGYFMTLAQKGYQVDQVLAAVLVICLLSLLIVKIVDLMEYIFIPWNRWQMKG